MWAFLRWAAVAGSFGSIPVIAPSRTAASVTFRAIGPAVSWLALIGTTPARLHSPRVGLIPTSPLAPDGQTIEPSVSVPTAATARSAAAPTPEPELEPHGLRSSTYGMFVWPPMPLQPLDDGPERKLAHSDRLAFAMMIAPAAFSRCTMKASLGVLPASAQEPAVVDIPVVSMLSLTMIGIPSSGRWSPLRRAWSAASASAWPDGLTAITACSRGLN